MSLPVGPPRLLRTPHDAAACRPGHGAAPPPPTGVLLADPAHFDIVDVQNPHMAGHVGQVDAGAARAQWDVLREQLADCGLAVHVLPATPGLADLVFTANPGCPLATPDGRRLWVEGRMRHASRAGEVPLVRDFYAGRGVEVLPPPPGVVFEGCGDALPVPGRWLLLGGYGFRTEPAAYADVSARCGIPVALLPLVDPAFYHLDTCLMPLDARTALWHPDAFAPPTRALIRALFPDLIAADADEARRALACNAIAVPASVTGDDPAVLLDAGCPRTAERLAGRGFRAVCLDTSEFRKSGGSCYCLKSWVW